MQIDVGNFPDLYSDPGTSAGSLTITLVDSYMSGGSWHNDKYDKAINFTAEQGYVYKFVSVEEVCDFFGADYETVYAHQLQGSSSLSIVKKTSQNMQIEGIYKYSVSFVPNDEAGWRTNRNYVTSVTDTLNGRIPLHTYETPNSYDASHYIFEASWEDD